MLPGAVGIAGHLYQLVRFIDLEVCQQIQLLGLLNVLRGEVCHRLSLLPAGVLVGAFQNFLRGQRQKVLPIAFLLGKHLLIEQGVQFLIGDKINFLSFGVQKSTRCV